MMKEKGFWIPIFFWDSLNLHAMFIKSLIGLSFAQNFPPYSPSAPTPKTSKFPSIPNHHLRIMYTRGMHLVGMVSMGTSLINSCFLQ
jgi:hypothetical protein